MAALPVFLQKVEKKEGKTGQKILKELSEMSKWDFKPTIKSIGSTYGGSLKRGDVFDLARAFLNISSMTHKKLQKLCYYAKAWYLALYDENLIDDTFEAWVQGAVQPHLYQEYRMYGFQYIPKELDARGIPEEFLSFAREIYESYGDLDGVELERLNHSEQPWFNARKGLKPWQGSNNIISEEDMKIYYRKLMENEE